jgi:hemoglobin-like flavoprotein
MSAVFPLPVAKVSRPFRSWGPASPEIPLTAKQKQLIRESFRRIKPALDPAARLFFLKLFKLDPALRKRFDAPVETQARKFAAGMKLAIITLGHEDGLTPTLKQLGARHRRLGIGARHYRTMAQALTWTLEQSLEKRFTRDTKEAWNTLLRHLASVLSG